MANTENQKSADIGSPIGIFLGIVIILLGIYMQDAPGKKYSDMLAWFISPSSVFIVLGSTLAAALVAIPINSLKNIPSVMVIIIRNLDFDYLGVIEQILSQASQGRKEGLFSLEKNLDEVKEPFFKQFLEIAIIERDKNKLKDFMYMEMKNITSRHEAGAELFTFMGTYAPAFGMMGTVMGLIVMMNGFVDSSAADTGGSIDNKFSTLLAGMGTALITTLYGVILANLIFLPIAAKLERRSENELRHKEIITEGILAIHAGEHPIIIKDKLMSFVPKAVKAKSDPNFSES